jgi:hypothetical protein
MKLPPNMTKEEKIVATAFFMGYTLQFDYKKVEETVAQSRTLVTVSDLKYNHDDEILVGGCINNDGDYRQFFLENMTNIQCWQKIYVET